MLCNNSFILFTVKHTLVRHFFEIDTSLFVQFKDSLNRKRGDKLNQNRVDEDRKDGKEK